MPCTVDLGRDVQKVVAVEGPEERLAIDYVNPPFTQGPHFLRVVGEELDALDSKVLQDFNPRVVASFIGAEAQRRGWTLGLRFTPDGISPRGD